MPLILVTGLPSSGKSRFAQLLYNHIKNRLEEDGDSRQVRIVSDSENLDWDGRDCIFMSIPKEKELRGWLRAETQRYVNLDNIVILDASAYIKGFRYELYCLTKEAHTQYCIFERLLPPDTCWQWNEKISTSVKNDDNQVAPQETSQGYSRETFNALVMRYEKCDENNRWDSPLFRIESEEDNVDLNKAYDIITRGEPLVPNKCTSLSSSTTTIYKPKSSN